MATPLIPFLPRFLPLPPHGPPAPNLPPTFPSSCSQTECFKMHIQTSHHTSVKQQQRQKKIIDQIVSHCPLLQNSLNSLTWLKALLRAPPPQFLLCPAGLSCFLSYSPLSSDSQLQLDGATSCPLLIPDLRVFFLLVGDLTLILSNLLHGTHFSHLHLGVTSSRDSSRAP